MPKLVLARITTVPLSLEKLLTGQMKFMQEQGFKVYMISSPANNTALLEKKENSAFTGISMTRTISPIQDCISLYRLILLFKKIKPQIIHTHTPKAGVLGMLAAWFCKVPVRLHTVAGLPLMEAKGFKKKLLIMVEKITYYCANYIYPNSFQLKKYILQHNFAPSGKVKVIANGTSNGIDADYYKKTDDVAMQAQQLRNEFKIKTKNIVFIFIGRIVKDKGINELAHAFKQLNIKYENLTLLLVGPFEDELDPVDTTTKEIISSNNNIICTGFIDDVRPYLAASDVLVFPSYREGFPNVPLQAGCLELPLILTDINGCNEIVQDGENGLLVKPKNTTALQAAMEKLIVDEDLRKKFSLASRQLIVDKYSQQIVWSTLLQEYTNLLHKKGINFTHVQKSTETSV